ncbi:hypothetical protein A616_03310 [Brevibacillus brevis X23]|nr:hypothetical protein A616_03310 [Brevibacillus brevis X23]
MTTLFQNKAKRLPTHSLSIDLEGLNVSYAENLLRVNDRKMNKTNKIKLPAYLANATYDQNNIYVLNYNTTTEKNELHDFSGNAGLLILNKDYNSIEKNMNLNLGYMKSKFEKINYTYYHK